MGDTAAALLTDESAGEVYRELEKLASGYLRRSSRELTLHTGTLVHEAYLRLAKQRARAWSNRSHFLGIAALMMRRILVEHARGRRGDRSGGGPSRLSLDSVGDLAFVTPQEVLVLDEALRELARLDGESARVVELRYFGGLSEAEIAELLGRSVPTIKRRWRVARAWLHRYLAAEPVSDER